jgi:aryl-alcohol dehydrogenase-like predicted oxidoreductase
MANPTPDASPRLALGCRVALGGAAFSLEPELAQNPKLAIAIVRQAYDDGIRIFDTARAYATVDDPFHNERLMRRALAGCDDAIIGTKGGHWREAESVFPVDNRPERLRRDVEYSLRALGLECLPLFYVHRVDLGVVPVEDAVGALDDMRREGKISRIGISNATAAQVRRAVAVAPIAAVQNRLSVRTPVNDDVIEACAQLGIAAFGYAPLRFAPPDKVADLRQALSQLAREADARQVPLPRLALRGLLASSPAISLVLGASRVQTVREIALVTTEAWDDVLAVAFARDRMRDSQPPTSC